MSGIFKPLFGTPLNLAHPLAQGLVGCWLFNENSGNKAYDVSSQQNHGTLTNMADPPTPTSGWGPGPHGGALAFDGINNYISILGNLPEANQSKTLLLCTQGSGAGFYGSMSYQEGTTSGYVFRYSYNRLYYFHISKGGTVSYMYLTADVPYSVAITTGINGTDVKHYINGVNNPISQNTILPTISDSGGQFVIGQSWGPFPARGFSSFARVYNRALSAEEVAYLYAFPYCMFEESDYPAWMAPNNIPVFMNHYRQMTAT